MNKIIENIKTYLTENDVDAYIIPSYENNNELTLKILGRKMLTRKLFLIIPKEEKPYLITHSIDKLFLQDQSDFNLKVYNTYKEMLDLEKQSFKHYKTIIMDISENGLLPKVSLADYGTVKFIADLNINIKSSADLLVYNNCRLNKTNYKLMQEACKLNLMIKDEAFKKIKEDILTIGYSDEYRIQQFIVKRYQENNMFFDEAPIVSVNLNASNPHYGPSKNKHLRINRGDVVLIDMWAKLNDESAIYSDITWMGEVSETISSKVSERFLILRHAVDKAVVFLKSELKKRRVEGYEVDRLIRDEINKTIYGSYFTHRTGHSIFNDLSPHGQGTNIDDYESKDTRAIIKNIAFSLEPGIYYKDFGMRLETDVYIDDNFEPVLVGGHQDEVIAILK